MLLDEVGHVVDNTGDRNKAAAVLGLGDVVVPVDDRQLLQRDTPVELGALLVELLLQLLEAALLDLVLAELLEVVSEAELLPGPDGPLGGVVLPPLNGVAVVRGELVVEVVVSLTKSHESGDDVVSGRVAVVEGLVAEPVGQGVDAEGGLLDEADSENAGVDVSADPVTPAEAADESGHDEGHDDGTLDEVLVLPYDNGVVVQVRDIGTANSLGVLLHDHPADVGVEQALADGIGVLLGVGITVVSTVVPGPPSDGTLDSGSSHSSQVDLDGERGLVGAMSPKSVVA